MVLLTILLNIVLLKKKKILENNLKNLNKNVFYQDRHTDNFLKFED